MHVQKAEQEKAEFFAPLETIRLGCRQQHEKVSLILTNHRLLMRQLVSSHLSLAIELRRRNLFQVEEQIERKLTVLAVMKELLELKVLSLRSMEESIAAVPARYQAGCREIIADCYTWIEGSFSGMELIKALSDNTISQLQVA